MPDSKVFHGTCLCGGVAFEVSSEGAAPITSCCHCLNCKKFTGTVFTSNVIFPVGSITITKGEPLITNFSDGAQDSGNVLERKFCSKCGTPLYITNCEHGKMISVFYSALDDYRIDGKMPKPQVEFYSKDRVEWVQPIEGAAHPRTKPEMLSSVLAE